MFTSIRRLLLDKDIYVKTHSGAKSKFHELFLKTNLLPLEFGKIYENAFDLRQEVDYDYETEVPSEAARQTIEDAAIFLNVVKLFLEKR
jgi:uncharacterized protein (UPF0332 family)